MKSTSRLMVRDETSISRASFKQFGNIPFLICPWINNIRSIGGREYN
jgi:hypothetical protein